MERTFSEHASSALATLPVAHDRGLPGELLVGSIETAFLAAHDSNSPTGNDLDDTLRLFTCRTCPMPPVGGMGCELDAGRSETTTRCTISPAATRGRPGSSLGGTGRACSLSVAGLPPSAVVERVHFALNDRVISDNCIPPYRMRSDAALARNGLPVSAAQDGRRGPGGVSNHWAEVTHEPAVGAQSDDVEWLDQTTSWESVRILSRSTTARSITLQTNSWICSGPGWRRRWPRPR